MRTSYNGFTGVTTTSLFSFFGFGGSLGIGGLAAFGKVWAFGGFLSKVLSKDMSKPCLATYPTIFGNDKLSTGIPLYLSQR